MGRSFGSTSLVDAGRRTECARELMKGMAMGMMSWGMGVWMLLGVLILVGAVAALVLGASWLAGRLNWSDPGPASVPATPAEVLLHRYAAGDIGDDELAHRLARIDR